MNSQRLFCSKKMELNFRIKAFLYTNYITFFYTFNLRRKIFKSENISIMGYRAPVVATTKICYLPVC